MTFDAAIIGGGISGLATAYALERQGYRVVVLERQHRVGGEDRLGPLAVRVGRHHHIAVATGQRDQRRLNRRDTFEEVVDRVARP